MQIVVPYTQQHPLARASWPPSAELVDVSADMHAYGRLLRELWAAREDFLVIEHDIESNEQALYEALTCPCLWGASPYLGPHEVVLRQSLGFTRFRSQLMHRYADLMDLAVSTDDAKDVPPGSWKRMDARIMTLMRRRGWEHPWSDQMISKPGAHQHTPVLHHHVYGYGCACGEEH